MKFTLAIPLGVITAGEFQSDEAITQMAAVVTFQPGTGANNWFTPVTVPLLADPKFSLPAGRQNLIVFAKQPHNLSGIAGLFCQFFQCRHIIGADPGGLSCGGHCNGSHGFTSEIDLRARSAPISHYRLRRSLALTKLANDDRAAKKQ